MTGSGDHLAVADDRTAIGTDSLAGVAVGGTSCRHSTLNGGVGMIAGRLLNDHAVELAAESALDGANGGIGAGTAGTKPIGVAIDLCDQSAACAVKGVNGGSGGLIDTIDIGAADNHVDVSLHTVDHSIEVIAAGGFFQIDINCATLVGGGCHVVTAHGTGQVVHIGSGDILLNHTELIGLAGNGGGDHAVNGKLILAANRAQTIFIVVAGSGDHVILGQSLAAIVTDSCTGTSVCGAADCHSAQNSGVHMGAVGVRLTVEAAIETACSNIVRTNGGEVCAALGTKTVGGTIDLSNEETAGCIEGVNGGSGCLVSAVDIAAVDNHVDIGLAGIIESIEIVTAGGFFQIDINSDLAVLVGIHIVTAHNACQIVDIGRRNILLDHTDLVGLACNRSGDLDQFHRLRLVTDRALAVHIAVTGGGSLVAVVADAAEAAGINRVACFGAGGRNNITCHKLVMAAGGTGCNAGGSGHGGGDLRAEEQKCQLGIVNEHIAGAGDGLDRVITTQLPGVDGVFLDPVQQNIQALDNTVFTPHSLQSAVCIDAVAAPANINVQNDTCHVAAQVIKTIGFGVGMIETDAFAVCLIAAGAVLGGRGRTEHHKISLADGLVAAVILTVGPGMLAVPGSAIPSGTDINTGIEGGNRLAVDTAVLAVGILIPGSGLIILALIAAAVCMIFGHQLIQRDIQIRTGGVGSGSAAIQQRKHIICAALDVERLRIGRQISRGNAAGTPVVDVAVTVVDVLYIRTGSMGGVMHRGHQTERQNKCHKQCQTAFCKMLHNCFLHFTIRSAVR